MASSKKVKLGDSQYEQTLQKWHDEDPSDFSNPDGDTDSENISEVEVDEHNSYSGYDSIDANNSDGGNNGSSSDASDYPKTNKQYFYGKNRYKWAAAEPNRNVKTPSHNILKIPCIKGPNKQIDPLGAWKKIFSQDMLDIVVHYTNIKIKEYREKEGNNTRTEFRDTNDVEIQGLLGVLLLTSVFKSNNEDIDALFATDGTGREIFRLIFSARRFAVLLTCLRFDTRTERAERVKTDPAAAISHVLRRFNDNSQKSYVLGANTTIDEMLVGFRGQCRFKMYIPSKPEKYGIKIQCLADARMHYIFNTYIYCGKGTDSLENLTVDERKCSIPTQAALRLCKPIFGSNRNVTGDNWYSSIELTDMLLKNHLTYVGTLKKNKKEVPPEFLPSKSREVGSTLYGFTNTKTLISRVPKKNKAVLLISTMHHSKQDNDGLPEINAYYNNTKSGVDAVDEKCSKYSCSRRTRRWPMAIFYRIIDMCGLNSFIIHQSCENRILYTRLQFLKLLAKCLYEPLLKERANNKHLPKELRSGIERVLGVQTPEISDSTEDTLPRNARKYCSICNPKLKRKTSYLCVKCKHPICLQCSKKMCQKCVSELD